MPVERSQRAERGVCLYLYWKGAHGAATGLGGSCNDERMTPTSLSCLGKADYARIFF
jgi:hypothetical protein